MFRWLIERSETYGWATQALTCRIPHELLFFWEQQGYHAKAALQFLPVWGQDAGIPGFFGSFFVFNWK